MGKSRYWAALFEAEGAEKRGDYARALKLYAEACDGAPSYGNYLSCYAKQYRLEQIWKDHGGRWPERVGSRRYGAR